MSKMTVETTITRKYLRNLTKDEIIEHVVRLCDEVDALTAERTKAMSALQKIYDYSAMRTRKRGTSIYNVLMRWCEDGGVPRPKGERT